MGGFTFSKNERLLKPAEFVKARRLGKRFHSRSFTLFTVANALSYSRLGLSASARIGNAVVRNRVKRLLREFFRLNKNAFPQQSDILISVKNAENINILRDVEAELGPLLKKAHAGA